MADGHRHQRDDEDDRRQPQVGGVDAEDVAEEERRQVAGVGVLAADDDHAEGEHADEQQADAGVVGQAGRAVHEVDAADHDHGADHRPEGKVEPPDRGEGDAGQHAVGERLAEECQPAHDDPRADERRRRRGEQPAGERPLGDAGREGVGDEVDQRSAPATRSALVRIMSM